MMSSTRPGECRIGSSGASFPASSNLAFLSAAKPSWLFSLQMYSMSSQPGRNVAVCLIVNGFAYAPGS